MNNGDKLLPLPPPGAEAAALIRISTQAAHMTDVPSQPFPKVKRSLLVTLLAWMVMAIGGLLSVISFISLLMLLAAKPGSGTGDAAGFFLVVIAPPLSVVAGFGVWRRWRWARYVLLLIFAALAVVQIQTLASKGVSTTIYTSSSGVTTTSQAQWGGRNYHSVPVIAVCALSMLVLLLPSTRREFRPAVNKPERHHQRAIDAAPSAVADKIVPSPVPPERRKPPSKPQSWTALALAIVFLLGFSGWMGWLVWAGLEQGAVKNIMSRTTQRKPVQQADSPALFWTLVATYCVGGLGTAGLTCWMLWASTYTYTGKQEE